MDFQLKTLSVARAAAEKSDVLIVLVGSAPLASKDPLSVQIAAARKAGDLPDKAGKLLSLYRPEDVAANRVVLAAIGDGQPGPVTERLREMYWALHDDADYTTPVDYGLAEA